MRFGKALLLLAFSVYGLGTEHRLAWGQTPTSTPLPPSVAGWENVQIRNCEDPSRLAAMDPWIREELETQLEGQLDCAAALSHKIAIDVAELRAWLRGDAAHASSLWARTQSGDLVPLVIQCFGEGDSPAGGRELAAGELARAVSGAEGRSTVALHTVLLQSVRSRGGLPRGELANILLHELLHFRGYRHVVSRDVPYLVNGACGNWSEETRHLAQQLADPTLDPAGVSYLRGFSQLSRQLRTPLEVPLTAAFAAGQSFYSASERQARVRAALDGVIAREGEGEGELEALPLLGLAAAYSNVTLPAAVAESLAHYEAFHAPMALALHAALEGRGDEAGTQVARARALVAETNAAHALMAARELVRVLQTEARRHRPTLGVPEPSLASWVMGEAPFSELRDQALEVLSRALR